MLGSPSRGRITLLKAILFYDYSNVRNHNQPTLQTDGQPDDVLQRYRATHVHALRGKN